MRTDTKQILKNANFIAIDFETATATRAACQIGIIVVKEGKIVERISQLIQPPNNRYSNKCIEVHGITPERTINAPTFDIVWEDIKDYFYGNFIVAHNAVFDLDVLNVALDHYQLEHPRIMGHACTYRLTGMSLEDACQSYNISLCNHHDGLCDAESCAELFLKYLSGEIESCEHTKEAVHKPKHEPKVYPTYEPIKGDLLMQDLTGADPRNPFYDKRVVITGAFSIDRIILAQHIKKLGAKIDTSVSHRTNFVIVGNDAGQKKLELIEELNGQGCDIKKINEKMLIDMLAPYFPDIDP